MKQFDYVVVGGGCIGLSIANMLLDAGKSVVVVDKGEVGEEASWAAGGMLRPVTEGEAYPELKELFLMSGDLYPEFVAGVEHDSGMNVEYLSSGGIHVRFKDEDALTGEVCADKLLQCEELLSRDIVGGVIEPSDRQVNNRSLVVALRKCVIKKGGIIVEHFLVDSLIHSEEKVVGVRSSDEEYRGDVVLTAGAWSGQLYDIPMSPIKGHILRYDVSGIDPITHIIEHDGTYLIPRNDQTLIIGATMEDVGFDSNLNDEKLASLEAAAKRVIPRLDLCPVTERWYGFRPKSGDELPIIGKAQEGLYIATGHHRNGILLTPVTAQMMKSVVIDGVVYEKYSPLRFKA